MSKQGVLNLQKAKTMHHVEIGIKKPSPNQVLAARKVTLRDRLLNAIFGDGHKMVVLVPGDSVGTISITEMEVQETNEAEEIK
ncbi:MAG: hypothetical protein EOM07_04450 [Clostridia bacterium]|jgi:hypothetical protein|nr:hypothetical protein [Clostridia bacterium]